MKISIPYSIRKDLARKATMLARSKAPRGDHSGDHAADHLFPIVKGGTIDIGIPEKYNYLLLLNRGRRAHTMVELAGKVVPIRSGSKINFRYVNPAKIGTTVPVINESGMTIGSKLSWTRPARKGQHFIEESIHEVIEEWKRTLTKEEARKIFKASPEYKNLIRRIKGK